MAVLEHFYVRFNDSLNHTMSRTHGSTAESVELHTKQALTLLQAGHSRADVSKQLAEEHTVTLQTARRWVRLAILDLFGDGDPMADLDLQCCVAHDLYRLEVFSDNALEAGDTKTAITAVRAHAAIALKRIEALERAAAKGKRISDDYLSDDYVGKR